MKYKNRVWVLAFVATALQGCGGGGTSTPAPPPSPATYSIGGTVVGLTGSVTLQNNGGDSLTLTSNGAFTFPGRVGAGGAYAVTVSSQPQLPDCTVANGSGTTSANVTTVQITCAVSPNTRYLPFQSVSTDGNGRSTGLSVLLSKRIEAPLRSVTTAAIGVLSFVPELTHSGTRVSGARPSNLLYQTTANPAGDHLYSVDLSGESDLVPRQLSNLVVAGLGRPTTNPLICGFSQHYKRLQDPRTAFFVLNLGTDPAGYCYTEASRRVVIKSQDDASTSPRDVALSPGNLEAIYHADGALAGLLSVDTDTRTLNFYPDETFRNPRSLIADVATINVLREPNYSGLHKLSGNNSLLVVEVYFYSGGSAWYGVSDAGVATLLFRPAAFASALLSGNNLVVFEEDAATDPHTAISTLVTLDQSAPPRELTRYQPGPTCNPDIPYDIRGDTLILWRQCQPVLDRPVNVQFMAQTLSSGSPPRIISAITGVPEFHFLTDESLVVTRVSSVGQDPLSATYTSEIVNFNGTPMQLQQNQAAYPMIIPDASGDLIQLREIAGPGYGGGGVFHVAMSRGIPQATTRMKLADGGAFSLPPSTVFPYVQTTISGVGVISYDDPDARRSLVYDLGRNLVVPLSAPGADLFFVGIDSF